jgi:endo-1,4-beta-xylanase
MVTARHARVGLAVVLAACGCGAADASTAAPASTGQTSPPPSLPGLRAIVASKRLHIGIGTAIGEYFGRTDAAGALYDAVLKKEFDVVTPENDLKMSAIRPDRATFRFTRPDAMLAYATANGMRMRGHTLVWGNQLPSWLTGRSWTRAEAMVLLDEHITNTVAHYNGKLAAWDVVNEAFNEDGTYKPNFWYTAIGPSYVEQAFRAAAAADPTARLFYNDYNIETIGSKSNVVRAMIADFKSRGVPIHGVGLQGHFIGGQTPSVGALRENMTQFANLGVAVQVTELDVRLPTPASAAGLQTQAQDYATVMRACLEVTACDMVVVWGFSDLSSWVPSTFPGMGAATLFDSSFQPKPAYFSVNDLLAQ